MKHKGTIVALFIILILLIVAKFGFNQSFERKEVIVEPTEDVTLGVLENTQIRALPTQN
ncbi:MAG: hypothetical protein IJ435_02560 [Clostridia bacterium]|nr:hypothetical protein [Clostridia bacterium]